MTKFWKYYLPPLLLAGFIFWNSARSRIYIPKFDFVPMDKVGHFGIYFILGYLLTRMLCAGDVNKLTKSVFIGAIILGSLYGMSDEIHQMFVPGRNADIADWIADTLGVISAQVAVIFLSKRFRKVFGYIF
jgi:VanZ family protein